MAKILSFNSLYFNYQACVFKMFRHYYADDEAINAHYRDPTNRYCLKLFEFMNLKLSGKNKILDKRLASSTIFLHYNSAVKINTVYKLRLMTESLLDRAPYEAEKRKLRDLRDQEARELKELFAERRRKEREEAEIARK